MGLDTAALTAIIGGGITIAVILANKFRCLCSKDDCKIGITENSILPVNEVELKKTRLNGHDVLYVSKNGEISSDSDNSEYDFLRCLS